MNNAFKPLDKSQPISRRRRNLPHWEQEGCAYFVTFRLADSLPKWKLRGFQEEKEIWLRLHPEPWSESEQAEFDRRFTEKVQAWLDQCQGSCALRDPEVGAIVESALRHFDGERYSLDEFVIMPNHVHTLFKPFEGQRLEGTLHSWKSYTASAVNKHLGRSGRFWMDENFDHAVRSWEQLERFRRYIRRNSSQAGLREGEYILGRGKGLQRSGLPNQWFLL